jgi:hypothetical protein
MHPQALTKTRLGAGEPAPSLNYGCTADRDAMTATDLGESNEKTRRIQL